MAESRKNLGDDALPFELALAKLEQIVRSLEDGELSLDESLQSYEAGIRYLQHCHGLLRSAERKISILSELNSDGTAVLECFEEEAMSLEQKQASRGRRRSARSAEGEAAAEPEEDVDIQKGLF